MTAKKSSPAPSPTPIRATDTSTTVKKDTPIRATRTDADPTHKADATPAGSPPPGSDVHDDDVDSVLAGVTSTRSGAIDRATHGQAAPGDDPTGGRTKGGASSVEQAASGGSGPNDDVNDAVRSSKVGQLGTELGTGGFAGPGRDGIQGALTELRNLNTTTETTLSGGRKDTSLDQSKRDVHIESKDHSIKVDHFAGDPTDSDPEKRPRTVVEDSNNHTSTTVDEATGATHTNVLETNHRIDDTPALQDRPTKDDKAKPGAPPAGEAETPVPADQDDGGEPDDSDAAPGNDGDDQTPVDGGGDDDQTPVDGDPENDQSFGTVDNTGAPGGGDDGDQSIGEVDNSGAPQGGGDEQSVEPDPADDPNGQSTEPEGSTSTSAPEDDPNGQSVEPDPEDGQSVEPEPEDGQSTEEDAGESSSSIPVSDDGSPPVTLPPDISQAIQADVARLRAAKPQTGNGFTDPGPDDAGEPVDRSVTPVPDVHNQILGGDDFNRDDDDVHTGNAEVPTGPQSDNGFTDPGPDDDQPVQTSGREQDPFDNGPDLKPIESSTTTSDDTDDDDDDGATIGSPLIRSSVVRPFQFDRVPSIADDDDDPDDD